MYTIDVNWWKTIGSIKSESEFSYILNCYDH